MCNAERLWTKEPGRCRERERSFKMDYKLEFSRMS